MSARAVLSFSRDLEFATETELAKRMGCVAPLLAPRGPQGADRQRP